MTPGSGAKAETDTAGLAPTAITGAIRIAVIAGMHSSFSGSHCACLSSSAGSCPPQYPYTQCALLGLNVAAIGAGIYSATQSGKTKDAVRNNAGGGFTLPNF